MNAPLHFDRQKPVGFDLTHFDAAIEGMHCIACARKIEKAIRAEPGVHAAHVNLTNRRLSVDFNSARINSGNLLATVEGVGFKAVALDDIADPEALAENRALIRALGVAGFAAGNVMIYSVAVWAGVAQDMGHATRLAFQWVAAAIALPAVAYAGQTFFKGAWRALSHGRINMDVPIAVAILLTCISSLIELQREAPHVYFDGAATLTFILLIGRVLDNNARTRARLGAEALAALRGVSANLINADGTIAQVPARALIAGQKVMVHAGERVPADGEIIEGRSDVDMSLVTGESLPTTVLPGTNVFAGTLNLSAPLTIHITAAGANTLLSEIARLMDAAAQGRGKLVTFADKAIAIYAPLVHILALATFVGWLVLGDVDWRQALINAVTVLIITCPCALGLAVPISHVVAAGRLFAKGVLLKSGDALERLAGVDYAVFDKTGTLTEAHPMLIASSVPADVLALALSLAKASNHPLARALAANLRDLPSHPVSDIVEFPGQGMEGFDGAQLVRLGNRSFVGNPAQAPDGLAEMWVKIGNESPHRFTFETPLRVDATDCMKDLADQNIGIEILSGDRACAVEPIARTLQVQARAGATPLDKLARLEQLKAQGSHVLMVGDGLNDAPALAAAHVSMAPASAAEISQSAADVVFTSQTLMPIADCLRLAKQTERVVRQNIAISLAYNLVAVPLAIMGQVTPLIAAVAMSVSSLTVVLNALRLKRL